MSEADWQSRVIDYARLQGWDVYHVRDSRTATLRGWPDLALIRDEPDGTCRLVVAELKTDRGPVRPEQAALLARLSLAGLQTHVWRPRHWEHVMEVLRRHR